MPLSIALYKVFTNTRNQVRDIQFSRTEPFIPGEAPALPRPKIRLVGDWQTWQVLRPTIERRIVNYAPVNNYTRPRVGTGSGGNGIGKAIPKTTPPKSFLLPRIASRVVTDNGQ